MIGKEFKLDIKDKKSYPKVIDKEETDGHLMLHLEFEEGGAYRAIVKKITTNGTYYVKVVDKI